MTRIAVIVAAMVLAGCAEISFRQYSGAPKPDAEVSIVRLWTPTTKNIFVSPGLIVEKIDGVEAGSVGRTSHAYLLPGEHELQVRFIQVKRLSPPVRSAVYRVISYPEGSGIFIPAGPSSAHKARSVTHVTRLVLVEDV